MLILSFGLVLMVAVLVSERAQRTVLSTSVIFLVAGFCIGQGGFHLVDLSSQPDVVGQFAEWTLFTILFVDGAQLRLEELTEAWQLPGRALLVGMPLTIGLIALACHWLLRVSWSEAVLVGAVLSPTDPVFVSAILEREAIPLRLRRLLRVESGLNDGIALPLVVIMLSVAGHRQAHVVRVLLEAGGGIGLGVLVPMLFLLLERARIFAAASDYRALGGLAIASVVFGAAQLLHVNAFLAAFASGVTLATLRAEFAREFYALGAPLAEALKLAALLVFGARLSFSALFATGWAGLAFAVLALAAARPIALVLAFLGGTLERKEWLAAAWFGPKGFSSLLYALLMLHAGIPRGTFLFRATALVIVLSIIAHSSTDVTVAKAFAAGAPPPGSRDEPN